MAEGDQKRVSFLLPEELPAYLDGLPAEGRSETVGGYKVRVDYKPALASEQTSRMKAVRDVIARSLGRFR